MVRLGLPTRLKSSNGKNGEGSQPGSRGTSPMRTPPADSKGLVLKTKVIRVGLPQYADRGMD
jgi:hypothetical protein